MRRTIAVILIAAAAGPLCWYAVRSMPPAQAAVPARPAAPVNAPAPTLAAKIEREVVSIDPSLFDTPQAKAYMERQEFDARARRFFADPKAPATPAREAEAQALAKDIDRYERNVQLSAGEAMGLRIGLVRATVDDAAEQAERIADIIELYRRDATQREAKFLAQQNGDKAFAAYKSRELEIVNEVMAMPAIPGGITREEYLRQRLQAERVSASHRQ